MNCLYVSNPKKELHNYNGLDVPERGTIEYITLIINAQTGEMQDYMSGADVLTRSEIFELNDQNRWVRVK